MLSQMPKAILFDLDGTLWDRTAAVQTLLLQQHEHSQESLSHVIQPREYVSEIMALEANGSALGMAGAIHKGS